MAYSSSPISHLLSLGIVSAVSAPPTPTNHITTIAKQTLDGKQSDAKPEDLKTKSVGIVVVPKEQNPLVINEDDSSKGQGQDTPADQNDKPHEEHPVEPALLPIQEAPAAIQDNLLALPAATAPNLPSPAAILAPSVSNPVQTEPQQLPVVTVAAQPAAQPAEQASGGWWSTLRKMGNVALEIGKSAVVKGSAAVLAGTVKAVAGYEAATVARPTRPHLPTIRKDLEATSGTVHLEKAVSVLTTSLSGWIQKSFITTPFEKAVTGLDSAAPNPLYKMLLGSKTSKTPFDVKEIVEGTLLIAARNLASHASLQKFNKPSDQPPHHIFLDMMTEVLRVVHAESPEFDDKLSKLEGIIDKQDPKLRIANLQTIIKPTAEKLLTMAFPNKQNDIYADFPLNVIIWECLKEILIGHPNGSADIQVTLTGIGWADATFASGIWTIVQSICTTKNVDEFYAMLIKAYRDAKAPLQQAEQDREKLKAMPGGPGLLQMLDTFAEKTAPVVTGVLIEEMSPALAKKVMEAKDGSGKKIIQIDNALEGWLQSWMRNRIKELGQSTDKDVAATWRYLWKYVEAGVIHMVAGLVKTPEGTIASDVPTAVVTKLLAIAIEGLKGNEAALQQKWAQIKEIDDKIEVLKKLDKVGQSKIIELEAEKADQQKELEKFFIPIAEAFLKQANLDKPENLPIPGPLKSIVAPLIRQIAPSLCMSLYSNAQIYMELIKPKALSADKLNKLEHTEAVSKAVEALMETVAPKVKAALAEHSKEISDQAIDAIAETAIDALSGKKAIVKDKLQAAVPNLGLSDNEKKILSDLIKNLALKDDATIQETWSFATSQAEEVIAQVMNYLALSNPVLKDYADLTDKKEVLSNALLHILGIGSKHLSGLREDVTKKINSINELKAQIAQLTSEDLAPQPALQNCETALKEQEGQLTALFLPIAKDLAVAAGIANNPLQQSLVEKILPGFIKDVFVDVVITQPLPEALQQKLHVLDKNNKLPELCKVLANKITTKLEAIFKTNGPKIAKLLNEELLKNKLPLNDELWLGAEIKTIAGDQGQTTQKAWGFLQDYTQKLLHHVFAHLALSYDNGAAPAEDADVLSNCFKQLMKIIHQHSQAAHGNDSLYDQILKGLTEYDALADGPLKKAKHEQLLALLKPAIVDLLKSAGIGSAKELPVPSFIQQPLWDSLSNTILPDLALNIISDLRPKETLTVEEKAKVQTFKGHADLKETIEVVAQNIVPEVFDWLGKNNKKLADQLKDALDDEGFEAIEKSWLENIIKHLADTKDNAVHSAWRYIEKFLAGNIFKAAEHVALADPAGDQGAMLYNNILTKVMLNSLKVIQKHVKNKKDIIEAAVKEYDQLSLLRTALQAAKKHFKNNKAAIQAKLTEIKNSQAPAADQAVATEKLLDAETKAILEALKVDAPGAVLLANAGRQVLMKAGHPHLNNDAEVLRTLFFSTLMNDVASHEAKDIDIVFKKSQTALEGRVQFVKTAEEALLKQTFGEAADEAMKMAGLEKAGAISIPGVGKAFTLDSLKETMLPRLFLSLYKDITKPQADQPVIMKQLNELLYDPVSLPKDMQQGPVIMQPYDNLDQLKSELWKKAGTADVAANMDNICKVFSKDIKDVIKKFLGSDSKQVAGLINDVLPTVKLKQGGVDLIAEAIKDLAGSADPAVKGTFDYMQEIVHVGLLKVLVRVGESTEATMPVELGQNPQKVLISNILVRLFANLAKHKDAINIKMADYRKLPNDEKLKKEKLREIFKPIGTDLLKMSGLQISDLPVPDALKDKLWLALGDEILPDLLAKMFLEATSWENEKEENKNKLRFVFGTTHAQEAVPVIGKFAAEATRQYLALDSADAAGAIADGFRNYLAKAGTPEGHMAAAYLADNKELVKFVLGQNLKNIATYDDPAMKWAWPATKEYVEATLMKIFANMSGRIASVEGGKSDFLVDTSVKLLQVMTKHFTRINQITETAKVPHAFKVDSIKMLSGFQNPNANPLDKDNFNVTVTKEFLEAKKAVKVAQTIFEKERRPEKKKAAKVALDDAQSKLDSVRKELYFVPLAEKFLEMAGIKSAENLPFPSPVREELWELCKKELVPSVLQNIFKTMMDKHTLNSIMLNSIEALNEALDSADTSVQNAPAPENDDPKQRELNKACGELVLELIKMVPQTLTKSVFRIDKVKTMTAETIGQAVRNQLSKWTMLKMIDEGMFKGMPNLTPGTWQGPVGEEHFVPKQADFGMALTPEEKKKQEAIRQKEAEATQNKLKKTLTDTLSAQIKVVFNNFFINQWVKFQAIIDKLIAKHCGAMGVNVKKFLDVIFRKMFIDIIGSAIGIIGWPFYKLFWLCMDVHLGWKTNQIIENVHLDIHENMFYEMTNELFKSFKEHEPKPVVA